MKKGKSVKLNLFNPIKSIYGTVDSKDLKSVYINIQSWVSPKFEHDNWNRVVCNLSREIKHSVFNSINLSVFQEKSIADCFSIGCTNFHKKTIRPISCGSQCQ